MYVAVPIYATVFINSADPAEVQRVKNTIEQMLKNDMVKMMLAGSNVNLVGQSVGEPYECAPPGQPQAQQQAYYGNGRR